MEVHRKGERGVGQFAEAAVDESFVEVKNEGELGSGPSSKRQRRATESKLVAQRWQLAEKQQAEACVISMRIFST